MLGINLPIKFILPKNICIPFLWVGKGKVKIGLTLLRYIVIPFFESIWPSSLHGQKNMHFLRLRETPYSLHLLNIFLKWSKCSLASFEKKLCCQDKQVQTCSWGLGNPCL